MGDAPTSLSHVPPKGEGARGVKGFAGGRGEEEGEDEVIAGVREGPGTGVLPVAFGGGGTGSSSSPQRESKEEGGEETVFLGGGGGVTSSSFS